MSDTVQFDRNAITPGTAFMARLCAALKLFGLSFPGIS